MSIAKIFQVSRELGIGAKAKRGNDNRERARQRGKNKSNDNQNLSPNPTTRQNFKGEVRRNKDAWQANS